MALAAILILVGAAAVALSPQETWSAAVLATMRGAPRLLWGYIQWRRNPAGPGAAVTFLLDLLRQCTQGNPLETSSD